MEGKINSEDIEGNLATLVEWLNGQNQIPNFTGMYVIGKFQPPLPIFTYYS